MKVTLFILLISMTGLLGGCSDKENDLQSEKKADEVNVPAANAPLARGDSVKLEIGESQRMDLWTQTFVYPDNIDEGTLSVGKNKGIYLNRHWLSRRL